MSWLMTAACCFISRERVVNTLDGFIGWKGWDKRDDEDDDDTDVSVLTSLSKKYLVLKSLNVGSFLDGNTCSDAAMYGMDIVRNMAVA